MYRSQGTSLESADLNKYLALFSCCLVVFCFFSEGMEFIF